MELIETTEMYLFLFCLLDVCGSLLSVVMKNSLLNCFLTEEAVYARNVSKNLDDPEPDEPSSNSKHISSRRFLFEFPSPGLETEFPR